MRDHSFTQPCDSSSAVESLREAKQMSLHCRSSRAAAARVVRAQARVAVLLYSALQHGCHQSSAAAPKPSAMAAPPLTAVWDPHTELLGGQRQPRAGHQQRSPSPHTLSSPWWWRSLQTSAGCRAVGRLSRRWSARSTCSAGRTPSVPQLPSLQSVPPPLPMDMAVLPFPPQHPVESLCIAFLCRPDAPRDPAALPTPNPGVPISTHCKFVIRILWAFLEGP